MVRESVVTEAQIEGRRADAGACQLFRELAHKFVTGAIDKREFARQLADLWEVLGIFNEALAYVQHGDSIVVNYAAAYLYGALKCLPPYLALGSLAELGLDVVALMETVLRRIQDLRPRVCEDRYIYTVITEEGLKHYDAESNTPISLPPICIEPKHVPPALNVKGLAYNPKTGDVAV